jgi:predicted dehydrogenase
VLGRYSGLKTYTDYDKMLDETDLDAVVIATPSRFHAPMVRKALDHGLHVFCEKPFVLSTEEGGELVELARRRGVVSQVGYHNRFVGAIR